MKFSTSALLLTLASAWSSLAAAADAALAAAPGSTPGYPGLTVTPAFIANLTVGETLTIPLEGGGLRVIRPITGGTLKGPLLDATVHGGFAAPILYNGGAQEQPFVYVYGTAKDGSAIYIQETGVGDLASWLTKVEVEASGAYANLSNEYIVANNAAVKTAPVLVVPVYKVMGQGCC